MNMTPEGTYRATIDGMTVGQTSKGTPQIVIAINVHVSTSDIRRRTISLFMSDKAAQYSEEKLRDLGFNGDYDNPRLRDDLYTEGCEVYCKHETYESNGETRHAERWNFSRGFKSNPIAGDAKAALAQRWRAKYGSTPTKVTPTTPAAAPAPFVATKPPPPTAPAATKFTKEQAWDVWMNELGNRADILALWTSVVQDVARGREESAFTSADWQTVADAAKNPLI